MPFANPMSDNKKSTTISRVFPKINSGAGALVNWITIWGLVSAGFSALVKNMTWLGKLNWAEAILLGIMFALITSLVASAGLVAFRFFKPITPTLDDNASDSPLQIERDWQDYKVKIEKLEIEVSSGKERMLKQSQEQAAIASKLKFATAITDGMTEKSGENLMIHEGRLTQLEDKTTDLVGFVDGLATKQSETGNDIRSIRHGAANLEKEFKLHSNQTRESFAALQQRETLARLAGMIEEKASILYDRLKSGESCSPEDWKTWEQNHRQWRSFILHWVEQGRFYVNDLETKILNTPDEKYEGEWTVSDDQFPTADAVRKFKQHRIQQRHWEEMKEKVDNNIRQVAFVGMKLVEVRSYE